MADYWMKLYIEILDDPKMATLPDRLWRRIIELFLLAKRFGNDGNLPDTNQIAWALRMNSDDLVMDLKQIEATGIIQQIAGGWLIVNFAKRQAPSSTADRKRQQREREHKEQYYTPESVTDLSRSVTQINRLTESESESESYTEVGGKKDDFAEVFTSYQENIGQIYSVILKQKIEDAVSDYGKSKVIKAIETSAVNGVRKWNYVAKVLSNSEKGGFEMVKQSLEHQGYRGPND